MNRYLIYIASFLLMATSFAACDEVEEVSVYADWQNRNTAFIDSIHALAAERLVTQTNENAAEIVGGFLENQLFALETTASTSAGKQYVYCKKIDAKNEGRRPLYTDKVSSFYYGTNILGERFDGNFKGYSAIDRENLDKNKKQPTAFDSPAEFAVSGVIAGWTTALQYMREGERWILYVPYQSAYGSSDYSGILAYSTLTFDIVLNEIK